MVPDLIVLDLNSWVFNATQEWVRKPSIGMQTALGYSVGLATSLVWQAGRGLWLQGAAPAGSLVALYPGVTYDTEHHR